MKCVILAGGTGDKMWPLSRRDYPKQFMNIKDDRSLFQETIGRNVSLCEEFFIMANKNHNFIIEGQMEAFQGLKYRCFYEETGRGTALPVILASLSLNPSELIFVINADHFINGGGYQTQVVKAMDVARDGGIAVFVAPDVEGSKHYDYFIKGKDKYDFVCNEDFDSYLGERKLESSENICVNTGLFITTAGYLLEQVKKSNPMYLEKAEKIHKNIRTSSRNINIDNKHTDNIENASIEKLIYNDETSYNILKTEYEWMAIDSFEVFDKYNFFDCSRKVVENNCKNVSIINQNASKLVIANGIEDVDIVNTEDAVYVTHKDQTSNIKDIIDANSDQYEEFFLHDSTTYRYWGYRELLKKEPGFMVRKVVILPGKTITLHKHTNRSEHWSVIEGILEANISDEKLKIKKNESAFVPIGAPHSLSNPYEDKVILIEVSIGDKLNENDFITDGFNEQSKINLESIELPAPDIDLIKLEPIFKDYLWGGTKLRDNYNKRCDYAKVAESWELSAHEAGSSIVATGKYRGRTFCDYVKAIGKKGIGWKAQSSDEFPILIKFIDANECLSIQVHPNDEYALKNEGEIGKNEVWYIIDCDEDSVVYLGLNKDVTREELHSHVSENTLMDILNPIKVAKGDVIFVEAGTIHAIGKGIMACEIQQSSNSTYRLYDYGRKDQYGNYRQLHLDKAMDVAKCSRQDNSLDKFDIEPHVGYNSQILARCKYFETVKYDVVTSVIIPVDDTSFKSFIIIEGSGTIEVKDTSFVFSRGDSFFMPAGNNKIKVTGECKILVTHI